MRHSHLHVVSLLCLSLTCLSALAGCGSRSVRCPDDHGLRPPNPSRATFAPFIAEPKARIGSLPCTGSGTLFRTGDPDHLGTHHYRKTSQSQVPEKRKGIIYTREGGFLDIAHLRKAADWTAFHYVRIRYALSEGWDCILLQSKEKSVCHVRFTYPAGWDKIPADQRQALIDEYSIRLAQRMAITQTLWHEIMTWFGYSSIPMISEKRSAFTYDDTTSHILGAQVAGLALHDKSTDYDAAITKYLHQELRRLGAVSPDETLRAIAAVEGQWWRNSRVIRRQLDIGEDDGAVTPWIIPASSTTKDAKAQPFVIPSLENVLGRDMRSVAQVQIIPRVSAWDRMRRLLPDQPLRVDPEKHFPILVNYIREHDSRVPDLAARPSGGTAGSK